MAHVTLASWLADPDGTVRRLFEEGGPVAAHFPGYAVNHVQVDYAANLSLIAARGADPAFRGRITPTEADTGSGKTFAILLVALLCASLRGKRALVTSYTRELNRQMAGKDGKAAAAVVSDVVGRPCEIAVRRPRSAFASPTSCRAKAQRLRRDSTGDGEGARLGRESAQALESLADWTEAALSEARATRDKRAFANAFSALIETFKEENPHLEVAIDRVPFEDYVLDGLNAEPEQAAYVAYRDGSAHADVLIGTHAILLIDQSFHGAILDGKGAGWSLVVCDEANRLEDAGKSALGVKRSVASIQHDRIAVEEVLSQCPPDAATVSAFDAHLERHQTLATRLLSTLRDDSAVRAPPPERGFRVTGDEPWLDDLAEVNASTDWLVANVAALVGEGPMDLAMKLARRCKDLSFFLDTVGRSKRSRLCRAGEDIERKDRTFAIPVVDLSPTRREPSLVCMPRHGAKVLSRLWNDDDDLSADAVVLTSATLASPSAPVSAAYRTMLATVGLAVDSPRVSRDLALAFRQRDFGRLVQLVLPDPAAPLPSQEADEVGNRRSPDWVAYAANGIAASLADRWNPASNRVFVLCTSFDEAEALAEALATRVPPSSVILRRREDSLRSVVEALGQVKQGILLAVGAWDGLDCPGLIDHLVIPRLPFPAPGLDRKGGVYGWVDDSGQERLSNDAESMVMTLTQGLGRPFRKRSDAAKVWVLDPRIGLPQAVQARHSLLCHVRSRGEYLFAFPRRFRRAVDDASVFAATAAQPAKGRRGKEATP